WLFIRRKQVIVVVSAFCLFVVIVTFFTFTFGQIHFGWNNYLEYTQEIFGFVVTGVFLGIITRTLLLDFFYNTILAKEDSIESSKRMLLILYIVILLLFPFGHKPFIFAYALGYGLGFY